MKIKAKLILLIIPFMLSANMVGLKGIFGMRLKTIENEHFGMSQLLRNKASVIVFLLPDCPACESYSRTLNALREKYRTMGIEFYGIIPGTYNTVKEMQQFQKTYKINFSLLQDPDKKVVQTLNAGIAPSVFVINSFHEVLYKGRIDDWLYAPGKKKIVITKNELQDALDAIHEGRNVEVKETSPIGCIIE